MSGLPVCVQPTPLAQYDLCVAGEIRGSRTGGSDVLSMVAIRVNDAEAVDELWGGRASAMVLLLHTGFGGPTRFADDGSKGKTIVLCWRLSAWMLFSCSTR